MRYNTSTEKYLSNIERLYEQSNDNKTTTPQTEQDFMPDYVKRLDQMLQDQALVDNTLDFVPLVKLGSTARLVEDSAARTSKAVRINKRIGLPIKEALIDTHRNFGTKVMNETLGTSKRLRKRPNISRH